MDIKVRRSATSGLVIIEMEVRESENEYVLSVKTTHELELWKAEELRAQLGRVLDGESERQGRITQILEEYYD